MPKRPYRKLRLQLSSEDQKQVQTLLRSGYNSARVLKRIAILNLLDKGESAKTVSRLLDVSPTTVRTIAQRYLQDGLDEAIFDRSHVSKSPHFYDLIKPTSNAEVWRNESPLPRA